MLQIIYILSFSLVINLSDTKEQVIAFNIYNPEIKIELSKELKEISGLTWIGFNQLGAVQDEAGVFYTLDANTGVIMSKTKFSSPGDFEGVEVVGNCVYTLTSSGTLFYFDINKPDDVKKISTPLTWRNDAEGLGYHAQSNSLLIICKESGSVTDPKFKGKSVFTLNIENHQFSKKPLLTIKKKDLEKFVKVDKFKPSAIAIDPITQDIYILASAGKIIVVLSKELKIKMALALPSKKYAQPEGICFSPKGDLYISNEGKNNKANIYHLIRQN